MADLISGSTKIVGRGIVKGDARVKASGRASFAVDLPSQKRGVLCGKVLRSPHAHAAIVSVDIGEALALKGVYAVVTGQDVSPVRIGRFLRDRTVLARDRVRYVGEAVAAVAAVDEAVAAEALSLIRVEYQPLPAALSPQESLAPGGVVIHEELAGYEGVGPRRSFGNQVYEARIEKGDVESAFSGTDVVVEGAFTTQRVHPGFVEPKGCVASAEKDGRVTVWASTKAPFGFRLNISRGLGLPLSKVRVISPTIGGDFGGKGTPALEPICALLAIKSGHTVKMAHTVHEDLATGFVRHPGFIKLKVAADRQGRLLGVEGEVVFDSGAYADGIPRMPYFCSNLCGTYNVPAIRLRGCVAYTNNVPAGTVRAPGAPQTFFAIESLVDELARRLGLDPFEIRRLNALKPGDPAADGGGVYDINGLRESIDMVAEHVRERMPALGPNQGIGVGCGGWNSALGGGNPQAKCVLKLNEDGSATLLTGLVDNGSGQHVVLSQIVCEVLGLQPEEVIVFGGDTDLTPFDMGPAGSAGTTRVGQATRFAAEDARGQVLALAASVLEANPVDLEIVDRVVRAKGSPERAIGLAAVAGMALGSTRGAIVGTGSAEREAWLAEMQKHAGEISTVSFCTHAARVEVDVETGEVAVLDYVAAQDVGCALNRLNTAGQIQGAVAAGLGYALNEDLVVKNGRVQNPDFANYLLPLADTVPNVHPIMIEQPSSAGPYGARGIGEASITPVAAVIANAIYDAVGVRIRDLPITPEKVLLALKEK